jgi:protein-L-isoaspartate(D-aspartate) O-methyltransferase
MAQAATAETAAAPVSPATGAATATTRRVMVDRQLRPYDVYDIEVLGRFLAVPREAFLPENFRAIAYSDLAIEGLGLRRAVPAPLVLGRFLQAAEIRPHHKVLEIAGGAGYSAALLAGLAKEVVTLENDPDLSKQSRENLDGIGVTNVHVETGPLEKGAPTHAPYDVILLHGVVEGGLDDLFAQLAPNGRLVAFKRFDPTSGVKAVKFEFAQGRLAGERAVFDAAAPALPAFAKVAEFSL